MGLLFLSLLSGVEVSNADPGSIICKDEKGDFQSLVWNYTLLSPDSSYNQQFYNHPIPSKNAGFVKLKFKNVSNGKYKFSIYKIGYHANDPYTAYLEMGAPSGITPIQERELKNVSSGLPVAVQFVTIKNRSWTSNIKINQNDVFFIKMERL